MAQLAQFLRTGGHGAVAVRPARHRVCREPGCRSDRGVTEMTPSQRAAADRMRAWMEGKRKAAKPLPRRQEATVEAFRAFTRISSQAVYGMTAFDPKGYRRIFATPPGKAELGASVRAALAASRFLDPTHPEFDAVMRFSSDSEFAEMERADLERAGLKTRAALYRGAGHVSAMLQDGEIGLVPWRHRGAGHWEEFGAERFSASAALSDEELGAAVLTEIERSRTA